MAYRRILAALDFSDMAQDVATRAHDLAQHYGAGLEFIHVVEYMPPLNIAGEPLLEPQWLIDESVLKELAEHNMRELLQKAGCQDAERSVCIGVPKLEILRRIDEKSIDLLVVGSRSRHGLQRLLGSTAHALLSLAPCDVLAVRGTD